MNVLRVEDMQNLESILENNPELVIRDYKRFKRHEVTYLLRATALPIDTFSYAIKYCDKRNLGKEELISMLCDEFGVTPREVENRIREVKKINRYRQEKQASLRLHQ